MSIYKPIECTTPRVSCNVNCGFEWWFCECRLSNCSNSTTAMDFDSEGGCAYIRVGNIQEISLPCDQIFYKPKTALKNNLLKISKMLSLLLFSCQVMFDSSQPHGLQPVRPPCPPLSPGVCPSSCPLHQWCHSTSHSLSPSSPPAFSLSQHQGLFQWVSCSHQVAKVLELQHQSFQWVLRADFL